MVNSLKDIKPSITKVYQATFMALLMVLLEMYMNPGAPYIVYVVVVMGVFMILYMARSQVGVGDKQYFQAMIQHHSSAILVSREILKKTTNEKVKKLARDIIKSQEYEIKIMNEMLNEK